MASWCHLAARNLVLAVAEAWIGPPLLLGRRPSGQPRHRSSLAQCNLQTRHDRWSSKAISVHPALRQNFSCFRNALPGSIPANISQRRSFSAWISTAFNNLAVLYHVQGRDDEALPLVRRALAIREKVLGPEPPAVGQSLNNLAEIYVQQGRYAEAEPLQHRSLAIREKVLGPDLYSRRCMTMRQRPSKRLSHGRK
ncbi:MAG: tetratricopeptide repeat protein [Proteobacteria bacterium]|nr:tetratricopeptide repeat protein [Pseudomonadota bacterium]